MSDRLNNKGNVVIINGPPVSAPYKTASKAAKRSSKKHPDIKILSANQNAKGSREGAAWR
ncbi:hypothetical protein LNP74_15120 [Klebsiella pneumoniae subsp. pneumoniae]|nr:hypothetical protein [Klebsiella pneumoniae subsp. pneumoniae]